MGNKYPKPELGLTPCTPKLLRLSSLSSLSLAEDWETLPLELQAAILGLLPVRQRAAARRVCRDWKRLLDNNRRLWTDVRRLTLESGTVWTSRQAGPTLQENWSTIWSSKTTERFCSALEFLGPRSPLVSLELLVQSQRNDTAMEQMLAAVAASPLSLRSLAVCRWQFNSDTAPGLRQRLAEVIGGQPKLETLILGPFFDYFKYSEISLAPLGALKELERLRVLVLYLPTIEDIREIPASVLARLECLAVCYWADPIATEVASMQTETGVCSYVMESAPGLGLQFREWERSLDVCRIVWAREGYKGVQGRAVAAMDRELHSCNFLELEYNFKLNW